jgi:putative hydrolase of the HAD superfamily
LNRAYEALIVDFGGVLTTPLQDAMVAFAAAHGIELQDFVRAALGVYAGGDDPLVTDFETGRISEHDFSIAFAARLRETCGVTVGSDGLLERIFGTLRLEEPMLEAVRNARRAGLRTALCSNSWGTDLYPSELFPDMFDVVVISGEVGLRKPDAQIFELTIQRLGVAPQASVFVDDHPGHLRAAAELGITTVLHKDPAATIAELEVLLGIPLRRSTGP